MGIFDRLFGSPAARLAKMVIHGKYDDSQKALKRLAELDHREEAIPIFMEHFRKSDDSYKMSNALAAIGTTAVVEPLLEILQAVKPGKDGAPASALVEVPGGIKKLKSICSPDEYERILVSAHNYGNVSPDMHRALGDIATPKAIERLLFVLWQRHLGAETRKSAKEALAKAGKRAHSQLLKALEMKVPTDRRFQTSLRKEVLEVLKESGDEHCVPTIRTVMESDASVAEEARATIEAISKWCKGIEVPKAVEPKPKPLKTVAKTGDSYVDACFHIEFQELDESRDWIEMPEAKAITEAGNAGRIEEALRLVEAFRDKHADFHFPYCWLAALYRKQGRYDDARNSLIEGLHLAKSKYSLCAMTGDTEWELGNLPEAVKWWVKSAVIQVSTENLGDFGPFLRLSYVAEQFGLGGACSRLKQYAGIIGHGPLELPADAANKLYAAARRQGTKSMKQAIDLLDREYLS